MKTTKISIIVLSLSCALIVSCHSGKETAGINAKEAREDERKLKEAYSQQTKILNSVSPIVETIPVTTKSIHDDAADDPAIWVNSMNVGKSIIFGTNKKSGVGAYDLNGNEIAFYPVGKVNNIDVLHNFKLTESKFIDLVTFSNRTDQSIGIMQIDAKIGKLNPITENAIYVDQKHIDDIYGCCFYRGSKDFIFITGKNGTLEQYQILSTGTAIKLELVRRVKFETQIEGLVADDQYGYLYIGEEDKGIWKMNAEPNGGDSRSLLPNSTSENPNISYDLEGLTLYEKGSDGYIIASSQGNFSYAVFSRTGDNQYITSFKIKDGATIDGVEETDGLDVVSMPLGNGYEQGILVVQDGFNYDNGVLQAQNFKIINWKDISSFLPLKQN